MHTDHLTTTMANVVINLLYWIKKEIQDTESIINSNPIGWPAASKEFKGNHEKGEARPS